MIYYLGEFRSPEGEREWLLGNPFATNRLFRFRSPWAAQYGLSIRRTLGTL